MYTERYHAEPQITNDLTERLMAQHFSTFLFKLETWACFSFLRQLCNTHTASYSTEPTNMY